MSLNGEIFINNNEALVVVIKEMPTKCITINLWLFYSFYRFGQLEAERLLKVYLSAPIEGYKSTRQYTFQIKYKKLSLKEKRDYLKRGFVLTKC